MVDNCSTSTVVLQRRGRAGRALMALLIAAAAVSGCGSAKSPSVASIGTPSGNASPGDLSAFRDCLAKYGIETTAAGAVVSTPPPAATYSKAMAACAVLAPHVAQNGNVPPDLLASMLRYARCMRAHGVDVPDPQVRGGMAGISVPDSVYRSPEYQTAHAACSASLPASPIPVR